VREYVIPYTDVITELIGYFTLMDDKFGFSDKDFKVSHVFIWVVQYVGCFGLCHWDVRVFFYGDAWAVGCWANSGGVKKVIIPE